MGFRLVFIIRIVSVGYFLFSPSAAAASFVFVFRMNHFHLPYRRSLFKQFFSLPLSISQCSVFIFLSSFVPLSFYVHSYHLHSSMKFDLDPSLSHIVWIGNFTLFVSWPYHVNVCWQQINKFLWSWTIIWKIINRELFVFFRFFYLRFNIFAPPCLLCCWPFRSCGVVCNEKRKQNMQWNEHFWR